MVAETPELVSREISRVVDEAAQNGGSLLLLAAIEQVKRALPDQCPNDRYLMSEILIAATSAMVAVDLAGYATAASGTSPALTASSSSPAHTSAVKARIAMAAAQKLSKEEPISERLDAACAEIGYTATDRVQ